MKNDNEGVLPHDRKRCCCDSSHGDEWLARGGSPISGGAQTFTSCHVCGALLPAEYVESDGCTYLESFCPKHGDRSTLIWRGKADFESWRGDLSSGPRQTSLDECCTQSTCCALLEVTSRCNLDCKVCFASSSSFASAPDPSLAELQRCIDRIAESGMPLLQISGGEPTCREDLADIIGYAKNRGFEYVQLNTNGIKLSSDPGYAIALADSGLSFVFLQFDGLDDSVYRAIRGRNLIDIKMQAIENCAAANLGVTLVPTIFRGVNDSQIGDMLRIAVAGSPAIRGVHFQPATYSGRCKLPADIWAHSEADIVQPERFTLDELMDCIYSQAPELVSEGDLAPSRCDHPMCGFHAAYIVASDGSLMGPSREDETDCCCQSDSTIDAKRNREFVGRRWLRPRQNDRKTGAETYGDEASSLTDNCEQQESRDAAIPTMDELLERARTHAFTITAMAFQDSENIDTRRLERCSLHVYVPGDSPSQDAGKLIPFCLRYLS